MSFSYKILSFAKKCFRRVIKFKKFFWIMSTNACKDLKRYDPSMEINGMQIYFIENLHDNFDSILSTFQWFLKTNLIEHNLYNT